MRTFRALSCGTHKSQPIAVLRMHPWSSLCAPATGKLQQGRLLSSPARSAYCQKPGVYSALRQCLTIPLNYWRIHNHYWSSYEVVMYMQWNNTTLFAFSLHSLLVYSTTCFSAIATLNPIEPPYQNLKLSPLILIDGRDMNVFRNLDSRRFP